MAMFTIEIPARCHSLHYAQYLPKLHNRYVFDLHNLIYTYSRPSSL